FCVLFSYDSDGGLRVLPSFPTRRSSDLGEFSGVVVAEISHCESHPDADKLQVCRVNDGQNEWQIVCGAPNARVGIKVPLAQVGADRKSTRLNSSHVKISYAVFCLK